ncbi:hypothetical protein TNCT_708371 [Trichonephila clavata]|uniref:Uncharacterized protein n=1 Tax=Trichonephila clavata TaxID=2740835 RepID=A0A8X6HG15_TRICU|nr:hypothetical protein TNCT_708371 [Trichonephila clavata]
MSSQRKEQAATVKQCKLEKFVCNCLNGSMSATNCSGKPGGEKRATQGTPALSESPPRSENCEAFGE